MARVPLLLIAFAALAGWAGAQGGPAPLTAEERVKFFKSNRTLIENLVNDGVALADTGNTVDRAKACRVTARTLANSLKLAADDRNEHRVAELAELVGTVVRDGVLPNLDRAREEFPPGTPTFAKIVDVRDATAADLDFVRTAIPAGQVADHPKVKESLAALAELRAKLAK